MPELPEVETAKNGLLAAIQGATIAQVEVRFPTLRAPIPQQLEEVMESARIDHITRRSKYMLFSLSNGYTMLSHLGMSGRYNMYHRPPPAYKKHEHIVWYLTDGRVLAYEDPRRFGVIDIIASNDADTHPLLIGLGPEPLLRAFNARYFQTALASRKQAIKPTIMDAKLVVGVGNIYASEACFRARIHPDTPSGVISRDAAQAKALTAAIKQVLRDAIASGGSSLRDFWHPEGGGGYFQHRFFVYGRSGEPCHICQTPIEQSKHAGRSTFYCKKCQKVSR